MNSVFGIFLNNITVKLQENDYHQYDSLDTKG